MTEQQKKVVSQQVKDYLKIKKQIKSLEEDLDKIKSNIDAFSDSHIDAFVEGKLDVGTGLIAIAKNPFKMVSALTGQSLTLQEKKELCPYLPEAYWSVTPNVSEIHKKKEFDKILKQVLKSKNVEVAQDTRYDIKTIA